MYEQRVNNKYKGHIYVELLFRDNSYSVTEFVHVKKKPYNFSSMYRQKQRRHNNMCLHFPSHLGTWPTVSDDVRRAWRGQHTQQGLDMSGCIWVCFSFPGAAWNCHDVQNDTIHARILATTEFSCLLSIYYLVPASLLLLFCSRSIFRFHACFLTEPTVNGRVQGALEVTKHDMPPPRPTTRHGRKYLVPFLHVSVQSVAPTSHKRYRKTRGGREWKQNMISSFICAHHARYSSKTELR